MLVGRTHDAPDDHADRTDSAGHVLEACLFETDEDEPQGAVLQALDDWDGDTFADLAVVADPEPLVGQVPASVDHELGSEKASDGPAQNEGGDERVREFGE